MAGWKYLHLCGDYTRVHMQNTLRHRINTSALFCGHIIINKKYRKGEQKNRVVEAKFNFTVISVFVFKWLTNQITIWVCFCLSQASSPEPANQRRVQRQNTQSAPQTQRKLTETYRGGGAELPR